MYKTYFKGLTIEGCKKNTCCLSFQVKLSVFLSYIKSTTSCIFVPFLLFLLFDECWSAAARVWLAHWGSSSTRENTAAQHTRDLGIYGGPGVSQAVFVLLACFSSTNIWRSQSIKQASSRVSFQRSSFLHSRFSRRLLWEGS